MANIAQIMEKMRRNTASLAPTKKVQPAPIVIYFTIQMPPERHPVRVPSQDGPRNRWCEAARDRRLWLMESHGRRGRNRRTDYRAARRTKLSEHIALMT